MRSVALQQPTNTSVRQNILLIHCLVVCPCLSAHKNQYARDDPAFVVLLAAFLCGTFLFYFWLALRPQCVPARLEMCAYTATSCHAMPGVHPNGVEVALRCHAMPGVSCSRALSFFLPLFLPSVLPSLLLFLRTPFAEGCDGFHYQTLPPGRSNKLYV